MQAESIILSIVIPTFNSGKSLKEALGSIINQTFTNYEILIIDNLSEDNTLEILNDFSSLHDNIRWISEPDKGIYDAMNKGIKIAKGEWLYFMGSDDEFYNKNVLSTIFNTVKRDDKKIIYGDVIIKGDAGWAKNGQIYDGEFTLSKLIERNICHQAMFFHKSVFRRWGKYNLKYSICADWDMNLRLWSTYSFHYTDNIVSVFKGGNYSYQIADNYNDTEKWLTILNCFKLRVISSEFSKYYLSFLILSKYYSKKRQFFNSFLLKLIFHLHKIRVHS